MAQQIQVPNGHARYPNREHSLYASSTAGKTAYEGADQASPTLTNLSGCTACSKINSDVEDLEQDPDKPLHGWPALAKAMEKYPDFEAFPTFRDLNIKSLLYYQAELDDFRYRLQRYEWQDHTSNDFEGAATLNRDAAALMKCKGKGKRKEMQVNLITEMRKVLKEYNAALLQYAQINALPEAEDLNVHSLRTWLINPTMGNREISGRGSKAWGDLAHEDNPNTLGQQFLQLVRSIFWPAKEKEKEHKLVVPQKPTEVDGLTRWIANEWVPFWEKLQGVDLAKSLGWRQHDSQLPLGMAYKDKSTGTTSASRKRRSRKMPWTKSNGNPRDDIDEISEEAKTAKTLNQYAMSRMLKFTSLVATVIACLLPIVAITVLAKMHAQSEILGYMALFTALFALGLMWLTNPGTSRTEIFTATAAFSAVLVVFVQNQNGNSDRSGG